MTTKSRNLGFTLVELLVTISIVSVLASIAAPSMKESIENSKVKELSREFRAGLGLAQPEAIKRGVQVRLSPIQTSGAQWQTGWKIFADPNHNNVQDNSEELIQTYQFADSEVTLTSKGNVFSSGVIFLPSGFALGNSGISGELQICRRDKNALKSRNITIQASGNINVDIGTTSCS